MTQAEQRIVEFLVTSNATRPEDLPDWFLMLIEGDGGAEISHELITAASFILMRRERPGIKFSVARQMLAKDTSDPARLEALMGKIQAFRLSCCFERLKRAGLYEDVYIGDPFDLDGQVAVTLTDDGLGFFQSNPTKQDIHIHMQRRWGMN
jgi:hypothetical protein